MEAFFDEKLKNEEFINYIKNSEISKTNIPSDEFLNIFLKSIDLKTASDEFISEFLNNDFKGIDLTKFLKNNFINLYQQIFERFKSIDDFLIIKNWKISKNINEEILRLCIRKVSNVLIKEVKNNKNGNISLYSSLIFFLCNLFAASSIKLKNIDEELSNLEQNFPSSNLIEIYGIILLKGLKISETFEEHLKEYIEKNAGTSALSIWYKLIILNTKHKVKFLIENLNDYFVKSEDFVGYPSIKNEKVSLFTYLYKDRKEKYFQKKYIKETDYYQKSIKSITEEEMLKLNFNQAMKINNNMAEFFDLFKLFVPIAQYNENEFNYYFGRLFSLFEFYKSKFNTFNEVLSFYSKFYPYSKRKAIKSLNDFKNELDKFPLNEFDKKINEIENYNEYIKEVDKYKYLMKSLIFLEIYNSSKNNFQQEQEKNHFDFSLNEFNKLKELANFPLEKALDRNLINVLISTAQKNRNNIMNELYLIKEIFGYKKEDEKFDVEKIYLDLENLIPEGAQRENEIQVQKKEEQKIIEENKYLKVLEDKFNDCYKYYKENKRKYNDNYYEKYINYFKELFSFDELSKLNSNQFIDYVIKKMFIIYYSGIINIPNFYDNESNYKNEIQFIKDFFEILNVYKRINNNNLYQASENIKVLFPCLNKRMSERGNDIFSGLSDLFSLIVERKKETGELFSLCFINIIIEEIKIKNKR